MLKVAQYWTMAKQVDNRKDKEMGTGILYGWIRIVYCRGGQLMKIALRSVSGTLYHSCTGNP